jgi:hypothetical protein
MKQPASCLDFYQIFTYYLQICSSNLCNCFWPGHHFYRNAIVRSCTTWTEIDRVDGIFRRMNASNRLHLFFKIGCPTCLVPPSTIMWWNEKFQRKHFCWLRCQLRSCQFWRRERAVRRRAIASREPNVASKLSVADSTSGSISCEQSVMDIVPVKLAPHDWNSLPTFLIAMIFTLFV